MQTRFFIVMGETLETAEILQFPVPKNPDSSQGEGDVPMLELEGQPNQA